MIGEGNIVEIVVNVVDVERRPTAVAALQTFDPFDGTFNSLVVAVAGSRPACAIHCHNDHRGIIEIRIVRVGILKCPTARPHVRAPGGPVSGNIENLARQQPVETAQSTGTGFVVTDFEQRVASEAGVPYRRNAGLAVGLIAANYE